MKPPNVEFAGVQLAATRTITWRFQAGTQPYTETFSCYKKDWFEKLLGKKGQPKKLSIRDSRGKLTEIEDLFILHEVASSRPNLVSFKVADRRWKWHRRLIVRTYNMSRKTADKDVDERTLPLEAAAKEGIPKFDYRPYSLFEGDEIWTAKAALKDALEILEDRDAGGFGGKIIFSDEFSASDEFTMQNVVLRDGGDVAIERLLALIPGANLWINQKGQIIVYNQHDLDAAESYLSALPPLTWDGDKPEKVLKERIRPRKCIIHYGREVECMMFYEDDYTQSTGQGQVFKRDQMYLENVIQTVDPETTVTEFNPETGKNDEPKTVGPGTWVNFEAWLVAMNLLHGPGKVFGVLPWTFDTIKRFWLKDDLEGKLIGTNQRGVDVVDTSHSLNAVRALRSSFRQIFRISRRYMQRIESITPYRVALLDPISGMRMAASVWSQACLIPTTKGSHVMSRKFPERARNFFNIDSTPGRGSNEFARAIDYDPSPLQLTFVDPEAGIIRIAGHEDPYGAYSSVIPCHVVGVDDVPSTPTGNLGDQDDIPIGAGMRFTNGTHEMWLRSSLKFQVLLTIVPGSPNNRALFHTVEVTAKDIEPLFPNYRIQDGTGPDYEYYVPASELTARFAWDTDTRAEATIVRLLGLDEDDPTKGGIIDGEGNPETDMPGLILVNQGREIRDHSRATAAQLYTGFSDTVMGKVATSEHTNIELKGNMSGVTIQVTAAPAGKVNALHDFPGVTRPVSRFGTMAEATRKIVWGIVRFE